MGIHYQRVLPLLCGIVLGAVLLPPALAQNTDDNPNQNGNANRRNGNRRQNGNPNQPNGSRNNRRAGQPRPGLEVIQKTLPNAQITPDAIQEIKRQPIPYKPFPIMDPQTRQPVARNAQI